MPIDFTTVLSSSVAAGLIAGIVTLRTSERKIAIEHITKQREVWRDKIRIKAAKVTTAVINKNSHQLLGLYNEFLLLINPIHSEDKAIMDVLWELKSNSEMPEGKLVEFTERLSLMMKHDWERAKREAKPWFFRCGQTNRVTYSEFQNKRNATAG